MATLLRGLKSTGITWTPIRGPEIDRCINLFVDSYNSLTEQACLFTSENDYLESLSLEARHLDMACQDVATSISNKRLPSSVMVVSSVTELHQYSELANDAKIVYIDKLPPWGNLQNLSDPLVISSAKTMSCCLKHEGSRDLHLGTYRLLQDIISSQDYNPIATLRSKLETLRLQWTQIIQDTTLALSAELANKLGSYECNLFVAPDHPYTSLSCTIIPYLMEAREVHTIPHMFTNFSETWLAHGTLHTLVPPPTQASTATANGTIAFAGMQRLFNTFKPNLDISRTSRKIIFGSVCPEPRGKFGWTPFYYLKTIIALLECLSLRDPHATFYIKNKHSEPIEPRLTTLARLFAKDLTTSDRTLLARVDDSSLSGSIEDCVTSLDDCYFLQDGSSVDKCRMIGASVTLVTDADFRTHNLLGAGEKLGQRRHSLHGAVELLPLATSVL
ncbi:hypothetical protein [Synechococcus sp. BS55D]|uniref:hypothetical protein n=1 Tax=Synechococcus sp. BS55D TaxID=2055943 RepID=UPI00103922E3|nr:hypothetical protein [Synechococcus sp. BS55D]